MSSVVIKRCGLILSTCAVFCLTLTGCGGDHPVRSYLQKLGLVYPDEYLEDSAGSDRTGTLPGIWSAQEDTGSESGTADSKEASTTVYQEETPVDEHAVNGDVDDLIGRLRQEAGLDEWRSSDDSGASHHIDAEVDSTDTLYSDAAAQRARNAIGLTTAGIREVRAQQTGLYAYEHLNDDGQKLYAELYTILTERAEDIIISTMDEQVLDTVFHFLMADHPEIFYVDGYRYTRYMRGDKLLKIGFTGNYNCSASVQAARQVRIDEAAEEWLEGAPSGDDYEIARYIYETVINRTEYDVDAADSQNITSVLMYGRSVCQGYARATQYLLNRCRVEATLVTGEVGGVGHAWVLALIDGSYTYIDTTWGDASYQLAQVGAGENTKLPMINYSYLCVTTQELARTHDITDSIPQPSCTDMSVNYYVRENEYFTSYDTARVGELFERRYGDGSNNVTIKCSTGDVYDALVDSLIRKQEVFGYLHGENDSFAYSLLEDQYTIIIWLSRG